MFARGIDPRLYRSRVAASQTVGSPPSRRGASASPSCRYNGRPATDASAPPPLGRGACPRGYARLLPLVCPLVKSTEKMLDPLDIRYVYDQVVSVMPLLLVCVTSLGLGLPSRVRTWAKDMPPAPVMVSPTFTWANLWPLGGGPHQADGRVGTGRRDAPYGPSSTARSLWAILRLQ